MVELSIGIFIFMLFATIIGCITIILGIGRLVYEIITDYIDDQVDKKLKIIEEQNED